MAKLTSVALGFGVALASIALAHADPAATGAWKLSVGVNDDPCVVTLAAGSDDCMFPGVVTVGYERHCHTLEHQGNAGKPEDADPIALKELLPPGSSLIRHLAETIRTGESRSEAETTLEAPDGRLLPVSIVTAPLFDRRGTVEQAVPTRRPKGWDFGSNAVHGSSARGEMVAPLSRRRDCISVAAKAVKCPLPLR